MRWRCGLGLAFLASASACNGCSNRDAARASADAAAPSAPSAPGAAASAGGSAAPLGSAAPAPPDRFGIAQCCAEIQRNLSRAPAEHRPAWTAAANACAEVADAGRGREGLDRVRAALREVGYPAACQ